MVTWNKYGISGEYYYVFLFNYAGGEGLSEFHTRFIADTNSLLVDRHSIRAIIGVVIGNLRRSVDVYTGAGHVTRDE